MRQADYVIKLYVEWRSNPDNDNKQDSSFASSQSISAETLTSFLSETKINWREEILTTRRNTYKEHMTKIDDALFKKAKEGDVRAAELLYKRFDGWSPKLVEINDNRRYTFLDIMKQIDKDGTVKRTRKKFNSEMP